MILQQYRSILNVNHRTETVTSPGQYVVLHPIYLYYFVAKKQHNSLFIFMFLRNLLMFWFALSEKFTEKVSKQEGRQNTPFPLRGDQQGFSVTP